MVSYPVDARGVERAEIEVCLLFSVLFSVRIMGIINRNTEVRSLVEQYSLMVVVRVFF